MYIIRGIEKYERARKELEEKGKQDDLVEVLKVYNKLGGYITDSKGNKIENWLEDKKIDAKDIALFEEVKKKVKENVKKVVKKKDDK